MKQKYDKIAIDIIDLMKKELPEKYKDNLNNFISLVGENKYRASYSELNKLMHLKDWSPTNKLRTLL